MNRQIPSMTAMALSLSLATLSLVGAAAHAGEIYLYEDTGFAGRQVGIRSNAPSISSMDFNDRTSSIVVRAGRWEVCNDDGYRGECAIFEPGQYASLDGRFDKRVSSVREIAVVGGGTAANSNTNANAPQNTGGNYGTVQLYGQPNFRGRTIQIDQPATSFTNENFNDRASSLIVQNGTWELCTDVGYRGTCRTFTPGRYATLGSGMTKELSSARPVTDDAEDVDEAANPPIVLFAQEGSRGRSIAIASDVADLKRARFDNAARSAVIENGNWEFCSEANYRGTCQVLSPGEFPRLAPGLYGSISSVRAASGESREVRTSKRPARTAGEIQLFTAPSFVGNRFPVRADLANFSAGGFNDMIGSVIVTAGQWEMCTDANYRGNCTVFGPGRYSNLGRLTNQASSVRRID